MSNDVVRVAPLLRACLEVLRDAAEPIHGREALKRVADRVELTEYERQPFDASGQPRWENHLRWHTGDSVTVGWMSKRGGYWSLSEAGETALDTYDDEELVRQLRQRYQEIHRQRVAAVGKLGGADRLIVRAIGVVDPGAWTAYDDLAEVAESTPRTVMHFLASGRTTVNGAHRVLHADGSLPSPAETNMRYRNVDVAERLRSEGIELDDAGRAAQEQRSTAERIRDRLAELGDVPAEVTPTRRAWLVRGSSVDGQDLVPVWLLKHSTSLAAATLRPIVAPVPKAELKTFVDEDYQHKSYAVREAKFAEFDSFCNRMRPRDHVLTTTQGKVYIGRITGDVEYTASTDKRSNLRRAVEWLNPTRPVPFAQLPLPLPAKLHSQSDVVELTDDIGAVEQLLADLGVGVEDPAPVVQRELAFPEVSNQLARDLLVDQSWLQTQADLLWERRQLILYGPPGTGKTFLALALAGELAEPSAVTLVQFHPSYTYEDFFEGFRPEPRDDGQLQFRLRPGPFRRLVDDARQHPADPYILIIDEINRANLAKVFGELYFLLEYRDRAIGLLYSAEKEFTLPPNVFVVGTMNTADRSIALVDAAMRRRFAFVELHPAQPPTAGLLRAWLGKQQELSENLDAPDLLDELNSRIEDRELAIGPSYLMRPEIYRKPDGLARVWDTSLLPLLAEHHYGSPPSVLDRYRLPALRASLAARQAGQRA
ncbi:MAG: AAA family ATPase [Actinomycetota bacterium]|nr:AAA family ATPase [Actinomycetota bacterium]